MEIKVPTHNLWRGQAERYAKEEYLASNCKGLFSLENFYSKEWISFCPWLLVFLTKQKNQRPSFFFYAYMRWQKKKNLTNPGPCPCWCQDHQNERLRYQVPRLLCGLTLNLLKENLCGICILSLLPCKFSFLVSIRRSLTSSLNI